MQAQLQIACKGVTLTLHSGEAGLEGTEEQIGIRVKVSWASRGVGNQIPHPQSLLVCLALVGGVVGCGVHRQTQEHPLNDSLFHLFPAEIGGSSSGLATPLAAEISPLAPLPSSSLKTSPFPLPSTISEGALFIFAVQGFKPWASFHAPPQPWLWPQATVGVREIGQQQS